MTFGELIKTNKNEIRNVPNLTSYFISAYKFIFGVNPSCASCSINNEFKNLINEVKKRSIQDQKIELNLEKNIMENNEKTFVLSPATDDYMLSYVDKNKVIRRKFTNRLTDDFVIGYLTDGTPEEIEERKKKFKVLPLKMREKISEKQKDKASKNK